MQSDVSTGFINKITVCFAKCHIPSLDAKLAANPGSTVHTVAESVAARLGCRYWASALAVVLLRCILLHWQKQSPAKPVKRCILWI